MDEKIRNSSADGPNKKKQKVPRELQNLLGSRLKYVQQSLNLPVMAESPPSSPASEPVISSSPSSPIAPIFIETAGNESSDEEEESNANQDGERV